jgi:hypothetical protein
VSFSLAPFRLPLRPLTNTGGLKYEPGICSVAIMGVIQFLLFVAFFTWEVYLWVHVKHFGSQPYLNDKVKYFLIFVEIPVTKSALRYGWIFTLVIILFQVVNPSWTYSSTSDSGEWRHCSISLRNISISTPKRSFDLQSSMRIPCVIPFVPHDVLTDYCNTV